MVIEFVRQRAEIEAKLASDGGEWLRHACLAAVALAAYWPWWIPGVNLSDHGSFWNEDYPAVMLTDTAFYRNPHYHERTDRPETLDYEAMGELVQGISGVLRKLDLVPVI